MFTDNNKPPTSPELNTPDLERMGTDSLSSFVAKKSKIKGADKIVTAGTAINGIAGKIKQAPITVDKDLWTDQPTSKIYNAKTIAENQILGINRVVKLKVIIEGKVIKHFKYFKLNQSASSHHTFDLTLAAEEVGDDENHDLQAAQEFLGKRLTAVFLYKDVIDGPERTFVGVITEVGYEQDSGSLGNIIVSGFDPTILLDSAPHTQSFGGEQAISLNSIADSVVKEGLGSSNYDFRVESAYTTNIGFSAQYNETHYNYLARIAEAYGEQFFYDGEVLHFGKLPPQETPVELEYGSNVSDIKVKMRAIHVNPTYYGYNSGSDEKLTTGESEIKHRSDIASRAYDISKNTFKTPSLRVAPIRSQTYKDVDFSQKGTAGSNSTQVFITTGNTSLPFLYPGCAADIKMRKKDSNKTSYFTKLMIIECTHEVDARGYYSGTFQAIAADTGFLPRPKFEQPHAESQFAKVIDNADPKNQGRVQVRFDWQLHDTTEWIRVMTPDAGGSDKVSKNRGFMSIPEIGDQVMVDFIHDNPDRPFVMGSMFHGKVGGGGGAGNNVKSLSSKSGHIICLNDGAGIEIKDKNGNHVTLSGTGDVTTEVSNNNTEKIGVNRTINVGTNNTINIGSKDGGGSNAVLKMDNGGNVSITCDTEIKFETGSSSITLYSDGCIDIKGKNISINGTESVCNTSAGEVHIKGSGKAEALFKGNTTITGGQVDIN